MKNKSVRNNILIGIAVILIILIGVFYVWNDNKEEVKPNITIESYNVYDYEKVDFKFVVAKLKVDFDEDLDISLSNIRVNGIKLDSKSDYIQMLRNNNYLDDFSDVDQSFLVNEDNKIVTLFLPIIDKNTSTATLTSKYFDDVVFDLNKNIIILKDDDEVIKVEDDEKEDPVSPEKPEDKPSEEGTTVEEQIIDEDKFTIIVETAFSLRDFIYSIDGETYNSSSNEILHAIPVTLVSKDRNIYEITDAKFVYDKDDSEIKAEKGNYKTMDVESILNKKTDSTKEGALIFVSYSQDLESVQHNGSVYLKINDGEWFKLEVTI